LRSAKAGWRSQRFGEAVDPVPEAINASRFPKCFRRSCTVETEFVGEPGGWIGEWDRKGLESLLEYMERAPVSEERLEVREDALVVYRGNYHPGLGTDHRLVTGLEFLAMMVPHIVLRYQVTSRCYGAVSTRIRRRYGWIGKGGGGAPERAAVDAISGMAAGIATAGIDEGESGFVRVRRRNWARLIARTYLEDPEVCPQCGKRMRVLAALSSPAQDAVIERILKCRGEWDPPWGRRAPARPAGAPPGTPETAWEPVDPGREDWGLEASRGDEPMIPADRADTDPEHEADPPEPEFTAEPETGPDLDGDPPDPQDPPPDPTWED
jgi:hypothetical protein